MRVDAAFPCRMEGTVGNGPREGKQSGVPTLGCNLKYALMQDALELETGKRSHRHFDRIEGTGGMEVRRWEHITITTTLTFHALHHRLDRIPPKEPSNVKLCFFMNG